MSSRRSRRQQSYQRGPKQFKKRAPAMYNARPHNISRGHGNSRPTAQRSQIRPTRPLQHYNRTIRPTGQRHKLSVNHRSNSRRPNNNHNRNQYRFQTSRGLSVSNANMNRSRVRNKLQHQNQTRLRTQRRAINRARRLRPNNQNNQYNNNSNNNNYNYPRSRRNNRNGRNGTWNQNQNQNGNQQNANEYVYVDQNSGMVYGVDTQRQQNVSSIVSYAANYGIQTNQTGNVEEEMVNILVPRSVIQNMMRVKQEV